MGNINIYGIVSSVSNTPSKADETQMKQFIGSRFLTIQLVGEKSEMMTLKKELVPILQ